MVCFAEQVFFSSQTGFEGHDNRFAQWINGRIGHLRKLLPKVIVQVPHVFGHDRKRRIVAHRTDGLCRALCQYPNDLITLFETDVEHLLERGKLLVCHGRIALRNITQSRA